MISKSATGVVFADLNSASSSWDAFGHNLVTSGRGSVAEWLACWTQAQKARVQIAAATLSGNSLGQTVHTHCASVHQTAKLVYSSPLKGSGGN